MVEGEQSIPFERLGESDLMVGTVYHSGSAGNQGDDPICRLVGGGNSGGFRYEGTVAIPGLKFIVLYTTLAERKWPDRFEDEGRRFVYYGDNRKGAAELHETPRRGNLILRDLFAAVHGGRREEVPPIFVFSRWRESRDVLFKGLAVPGAAGLSEEADLVAFWKTHEGVRFLNYRAVFSMLAIELIPRASIQAIKAGKWIRVAPDTWREWVNASRGP